METAVSIILGALLLLALVMWLKDKGKILVENTTAPANEPEFPTEIMDDPYVEEYNEIEEGDSSGIGLLKILNYVFVAGWSLNGIILFSFWVTTMMNWLGIVGAILSIMIAPGFVIFPLIYWIVEGEFPVLYFSLLGSGIVLMILSGLTSRDER